MNLDVVDAGWLMGVSALIAAASGAWLSRRGQRDTATQTAAAGKLAERVQAFDEMGHLVEELKGQLTSCRDAMRANEVEHERRHSDQGKRCKAELDTALDTVAVLQNVVRDEIEKEAANVVKARARRHRHTDHGEDT